MQATPRIRVWSDRIPRVLLFIYFYRGLSGNMEERPTRRVYLEILTCAPIFHSLDGSRSHTNEREAEWAHWQGARPTLGTRPPLLANQHASHGLCSTASKYQGKPFNQGRFDPTAQIHLRGLYKQGPWPLEKAIPLFISIFSREDSKREVPLGFQHHRAWHPMWE